eukprot:1156410-Pelagomonas_calceolata.AAC.7
MSCNAYLRFIVLQAQVHHSVGTSASQCRHWCITVQAQVHHRAGTGASPCRHKCITVQALVHHRAGTGASQCRHKCITVQALVHHRAGTSASPCRHWCITVQALVHHRAGTSASPCRHWCITVQALVHHRASTGASQCRHKCITVQALLHHNASTGASLCRHWCITVQAQVHHIAGTTCPQRPLASVNIDGRLTTQVWLLQDSLLVGGGRVWMSAPTAGTNNEHRFLRAELTQRANLAGIPHAFVVEADSSTIVYSGHPAKPKFEQKLKVPPSLVVSLTVVGAIICQATHAAP